MSSWGWVVLAWAELILAYVGYGFYLRWRQKRLEKEDASSNG